MKIMNEPISVGVIGLGAMGAPMARHLAQAGLLCMVWNRTVSKADALAMETGADIAPGPEQLAATCNVILTCVSADQDLLDVVGQLLAGVKPGMVLIDTSTVSPAKPGRRARERSACLRSCRKPSIVQPPVVPYSCL